MRLPRSLGLGGELRSQCRRLLVEDLRCGQDYVGHPGYPGYPPRQVRVGGFQEPGIFHPPGRSLDGAEGHFGQLRYALLDPEAEGGRLTELFSRLFSWRERFCAEPFQQPYFLLLGKEDAVYRVEGVKTRRDRLDGVKQNKRLNRLHQRFNRLNRRRLVDVLFPRPRAPRRLKGRGRRLPKDRKDWKCSSITHLDL